MFDRFISPLQAVLQQRGNGSQGPEAHCSVWGWGNRQGAHPHQALIHLGRNPGWEVSVRSSFFVWQNKHKTPTVFRLNHYGHIHAWLNLDESLQRLCAGFPHKKSKIQLSECVVWASAVSLSKNIYLFLLAVISSTMVDLAENSKFLAQFHRRVRVSSVCKGAALVVFPQPKVGGVRTEPYSSRST